MNYQDSTQKLITRLVEKSSIAKDFCCNPLILVLIIVGTGVIGGVVNYLMKRYDSEKAEYLNKTSYKIDYDLLLQVLLGISGASLIPLLLYLTSSKLFDKCDSCFFVYFVFAGYCFIGAIFSKSLLKNLAKRLDLEKFQDDLKKQEAKIKETNEKVQEAEKFIIESKRDEEEEPEHEQKSVIPQDIKPIKEEAEKLQIKKIDLENYLQNDSINDLKSVLQELKNPKYKDRSINGLVKKTKLDEDIVNIMLKVLIRLNVVQKVQWYNNTFYRLTDKGKNAEIQ